MRLSKVSASKGKPEALAPVPALKVSFPSVRELRIELAFEPEYGWEPSTQVHILHPPSRAAFRYPCPFAGCSGAFDLDSSVKAVLQEGASHVHSTLGCTGVRPFDRSTGKSCGVRLRYRVDAVYVRPATRS
ncbi:MAG TPA: hypothetical protein VGM84_13180 [Steroidobacteraceae bacterium]|jgi:hypothetical protein